MPCICCSLVSTLLKYVLTLEKPLYLLSWWQMWPHIYSCLDNHFYTKAAVTWLNPVENWCHNYDTVSLETVPKNGVYYNLQPLFSNFSSQGCVCVFVLFPGMVFDSGSKMIFFFLWWDLTISALKHHFCITAHFRFCFLSFKFVLFRYTWL